VLRALAAPVRTHATVEIFEGVKIVVGQHDVARHRLRADLSKIESSPRARGSDGAVSYAGIVLGKGISAIHLTAAQKSIPSDGAIVAAWRASPEVGVAQIDSPSRCADYRRISGARLLSRADPQHAQSVGFKTRQFTGWSAVFTARSRGCVKVTLGQRDSFRPPIRTDTFR